MGALGRGEGLLELWDLSAGTLITPWQAETNAIRVVCFSPDRRQVVTGSAGGDVRIWDVATHAELAAFRPAAGPVTALAFSPDGRAHVGGRLRGLAGPLRARLFGNVLGRDQGSRDHHGGGAVDVGGRNLEALFLCNLGAGLLW